MTDKEFVSLCKQSVADYFNTHSDKTDKFHLNTDDVYIVWQCRALQNWKALVSTIVTDGMYYEVTHNGDRNETYIDCYKKWDNFTVKHSPKTYRHENIVDKGSQPYFRALKEVQEKNGFEKKV